MDQHEELLKLVREIDLAHFSAQRNAVQVPEDYVPPETPSQRADPGWVFVPGRAAKAPPFFSGVPIGKVVVICVLLAAVGGLGAWGVMQFFPPQQPPEEEPAAVRTVGPDNKFTPGAQTYLPSFVHSNPVWLQAQKAELTNRLRPDDFLENFAAQTGKRHTPSPINTLYFPPGGQPLTVAILLYARLDSDTESAWRAKGLLKLDAASPSPFIRIVQLKNSDDLSLLHDWHVDGALKDYAVKNPGR